jgi:hypothetical protein
MTFLIVVLSSANKTRNAMVRVNDFYKS